MRIGEDQVIGPRRCDRAGVVVERDVVRFTPVEPGARRGGRVAIESGLTAGQTIVIAPPSRLTTGDRVRIGTP